MNREDHILCLFTYSTHTHTHTHKHVHSMLTTQMCVTIPSLWQCLLSVTNSMRPESETCSAARAIRQYNLKSFTMFIKVRQLEPPLRQLNPSISSTLFISYQSLNTSHLRLDLQNNLLPSGFSPERLHSYILHLSRSSCTAWQRNTCFKTLTF
jgi:hypothetical protein